MISNRWLLTSHAACIAGQSNMRGVVLQLAAAAETPGLERSLRCKLIPSYVLLAPCSGAFNVSLDMFEAGLFNVSASVSAGNLTEPVLVLPMNVHMEHHTRLDLAITPYSCSVNISGEGCCCCFALQAPAP